MGYLDNSTTNITLDAVLTDLGRQLLSNNDNSFSITKFALGDDDIDYGIIKKYGRVIGKEKIEKNTPIMEALTAEVYAQKNRLMTLINPNLAKLPKLNLKLGAASAGGTIVSLSTTITNKNSVKLQFKQEIEGAFDPELIDDSFHIFLNNRFVSVQGARPDFVDRFQIARYIITRDPGAVSDGSSLTFTLGIKNINNTLFTIFGKPLDKNTIVTFGTIRGADSGIEKQFEIQIAK